VSYIDFLNVSEERKKQLKKQYYFDCTCEHCQKGLKDNLFLGVKEDPKVHTVLLLGVFVAVFSSSQARVDFTVKQWFQSSWGDSVGWCTEQKR
jgi:hypothetical protein